MVVEDFELPEIKPKEYRTLRIEKEIADKVREFAKKNNLTQTQAVDWLYKKAKECYESTKHGDR